MRPHQLFAAIWVAWGVTWLGAAVWSGRAEKHATFWDVSAYRLLAAIGAILLWHGTAGARPVSAVARWLRRCVCARSSNSRGYRVRLVGSPPSGPPLVGSDYAEGTP